MAPAAGCLGECIVEFVPIAVRVVRLEVGVVPVGVEGRGELVEQCRRARAGEAYVPLDAFEHGCPGEVGRAHIGGVELGVAAEHPGFRMQAGALGVVLDLYLRTELAHQSVERNPFGGAEIGGREDAQRRATRVETAEFRLEEAKAVPAYERAEEVYLVGGVDLGAQLRGQARLLFRVGEEGSLGKRSLRARVEVGERARTRLRRDATELRWRMEDLVDVAKSADQIVGGRHAALGVLDRVEAAYGCLIDVPGKDMRLIGLVYLAEFDLLVDGALDAVIDVGGDEEFVQAVVGSEIGHRDSLPQRQRVVCGIGEAGTVLLNVG